MNCFNKTALDIFKIQCYNLEKITGELVKRAERK